MLLVLVLNIVSCSDDCNEPALVTDPYPYPQEYLANKDLSVKPGDCFVQGFTGEKRNEQLRKFYEAYSHIWCIQYGQKSFDYIKNQDVHAPARLRNNGVVMNTDLWYDLYNVDSNNLLYLPPERRAYIW